MYVIVVVVYGCFVLVCCGWFCSVGCYCWLFGLGFLCLVWVFCVWFFEIMLVLW